MDQSASTGPRKHARPEGGTTCDPARIEAFVLGPYQTNCYLVYVGTGPDCWIVDCGFDPQEMIDRVQELRLTPTAIILTHAHIDHIAGLAEVRRAFPGVPVMIHRAERDWLGDPELNLSAFAGLPISGPDADRLLEEGDELTLAGSTWRVLHTPGHSPGGITLYSARDNSALVGDALFAGSIGRTDFPGCSFEELEQSIRTKLYTLPEETRIYPGHGPGSTIGRERRTNPFVNG
jgi:hydroxyacylglutathione hydrolase